MPVSTGIFDLVYIYMDWKNKPPFGISDHGILTKLYCESALQSFSMFELKPNFSENRLTECFIAWKYDLEKSVDRFKPEKKSSPDHVKCAGYLMYWLRRNNPIWSVDDTFEKFATENEKVSLIGRYGFLPYSGMIPEGAVEITNPSDINPDDPAFESFSIDHNGLNIFQFRNHRNRLKSYANEYIAFDFCFRLAKSYEEQKLKELGFKKSLRTPSEVFIDDFCYFLKYKSVSPHSLAFILRAAIQE